MASAPIRAFLELFKPVLYILPKPPANFPHNHWRNNWTEMREEWILSQWLSSILGNNIGRAGDQTSDLLFSSSQRYRLSYGTPRRILNLLMITCTELDWLNPFPNKPWFLRVCSTSLSKTLWEKEKLLVTSNFSFSHSVFYPFTYILPFTYNLKLSSANPFRLEEFVVWERVNGIGLDFVVRI